MDTTWKAIIWNQFGAAIGMLGNALRSCLENLRNNNKRHRKWKVGKLALLAVLSLPVSECIAQINWAGPAERLRGWQEDLDTTITVFLARDKSFDSLARAEFSLRIRQLRDSVDLLSDAQLITRLAAAVAGAQNAHTRLYLLRNRTVLRRYPLRVWWFGDDLHVIRTRPEHSGLLGGKVVAIAWHPVMEAFDRVKPLYAGNRSWMRYISTYLLTSPEILEGVGVLKGSDELALTLEMRDGRRQEVRLQPLPLYGQTGPSRPGGISRPPIPDAKDPGFRPCPRIRRGCRST